jgi:hypothetical protein
VPVIPTTEGSINRRITIQARLGKKKKKERERETLTKK